MQTWQIVNARQGSSNLLAECQAREFAAREFPREDFRWVLASANPTVPVREARGVRGRLAGILRAFGIPGKSETDPEAATERAPA